MWGVYVEAQRGTGVYVRRWHNAREIDTVLQFSESLSLGIKDVIDIPQRLFRRRSND